MSDTEISPLEYDNFSKSYHLITRLGFGSFGCAVLAKYRKNIDSLLSPQPHKDGTLMEPLKQSTTTMLCSDGLVAIKIMKNQLRKPSDYLKVNEIRFILAVPSHPNLLQILDLFIDTLSGKLHIVMEPMDQNLYQFIQKHEQRPLAPWVVKSMLAQLLNAIRHIHSHGFFHRDVKPENILVTSSKKYFGQQVPPERSKDLYILKLCDYGLSRHVSNTRELTQYVSTRWYRAPEILLRQKEYSCPIDIWAFGSVAVELINRRPLFAGLNETDQIWQILTKLGHPLYQERGSDDLGGVWKEGVRLAEKLGFIIPYIAGQSLSSLVKTEYKELGMTIKSCFMWDPEKRPTAEALSRESYFRGTILDDFEQYCTLKQRSCSIVTTSSLGENNTSLHNQQVKGKKHDLLVSVSHSDRNSKPRKAELYSDPLYFFKSSSQSSTEFEDEKGLHDRFLDFHSSEEYFHESKQLTQDANNRMDLSFDDTAFQADTSFGSHEISC